MKKTGLLTWAMILLLAGTAVGQGLGNAPYSRLGLGDYNPNLGGVRQLGMGGVGVAAPNAVNVNELNPALLYYVARTTFEASVNGQYKTVKNASNSSRSGSGTLAYLALAVPLSSKWGAAAGLKPLTSVDYESTVLRSFGNDTVTRALQQRLGSGGLSEVYLAQGYRVAKNLSLGATASYIFGTVDETSGSTDIINGVSTGQRIVVREHTHYSDFMFRAGLHYRHKLGRQLNMNVGGVYTFRTNVGGRQAVTQEREDASGVVTSRDTLNRDAYGQATLPGLAQLGITLDNDKNWTLNLDVAHQQWSNFRTSFDAASTPLHDTWRVGLGGELTPDPGSVEHYFQRVTYRVGLNVAQMPYQPSGEVLYDRSVSWGFAFPIPTASPLEASTFSLAFTYGMRGNTDVLGTNVSNVQENYIRGQFGVTLNNRWFIKRRLL